jgi:hypothetical protein
MHDAECEWNGLIAAVSRRVEMTLGEREQLRLNDPPFCFCALRRDTKTSGSPQGWQPTLEMQKGLARMAISQLMRNRSARVRDGEGLSAIIISGEADEWKELESDGDGDEGRVIEVDFRNRRRLDRG